MKRKTFLASLGAAAVASTAGPAFAQAYPSRPVTMVSPFPAGSGNDLTARAVQPALSEALGQPVVIENRAGAGGAVGAQHVAKSRNDGYTILLSSLSFSILPALMQLNFDPAKDFEAITLMGNQPMALLVPPSLPVKSLGDLVALARSKPGVLNYASAGAGSIGHLVGELLQTERGIKMVHVPYKGTPAAMAAVMTGEAQMSLVTMPAAEPQIKAGKVKVIAVTGANRYAGLPDVPTIGEAGLPSANDSVWYAVLVPTGTPREAVNRLNAAFRKALADKATIDRMTNTAKTIPAISSPEEATTFVRAQVAKWVKVAQGAGLKPA